MTRFSFSFLFLFFALSVYLLPTSDALSTKLELVVDEIPLTLSLALSSLACKEPTDGQTKVGFYPSVSCLRTTYTLGIGISTPQSLSVCTDAGFEIPYISCDFVSYYQYGSLLAGEYLPIENYPCDTFTDAEATSYRSCGTTWTPPSTSKLLTKIKFSLLPPALQKQPPTNAPTVAIMLQDNLLNQSLSSVLDLVGNLISYVPLDGTCQICNTSSIKCDRQWLGCEDSNINLFCEQFGTPETSVLCNDLTSVDISPAPCATLDNKYIRTAQNVKTCSVVDIDNNNNILYTFNNRLQVPNCSSESHFVFSASDYQEALILPTLECPASPPTISRLYCNGQQCPESPQQICQSTCQQFPTINYSCRTFFLTDLTTQIDQFDSNELIGGSNPLADECRTLYSSYHSLEPPFCHLGCKVEFFCAFADLLTDFLPPLTRYGQCNEVTLRDYIDQLPSTAVTCGDITTLAVPKNRIITKISSPSQTSPLLFSTYAKARDSFDQLMTALGYTNDNGIDISLPGYKGCNNVKMVCYDKYNDLPSSATVEKCNLINSLNVQDIILDYSDVFYNPTLKCSQGCNIGVYEIIPLCRYYKDDDTPLNSLPLSNPACLTALKLNSIQIPKKIITKCLDITQTTCPPPQLQCTLNKVGFSTPEACFDSNNKCTMGLSETICDPPNTTTPTYHNGSRTVDGCYYNNMKLKNDQLCTQEEPIMSFKCPKLVCPEIAPTPTTPTLSLTQLNPFTNQFELIYQDGGDDGDDDTGNVSRGAVVVLKWAFPAEFTLPRSPIALVDIKIDSYKFPIVVGSVDVRVGEYSIDLKKIKTFESIAFTTTSTISFTLRSLSYSISTPQLLLLSQCNSNHVGFVQCDSNSTNDNINYKTGYCDENLQQCICYNGFYGPKCDQQLCQKAENGSGVTLQCGSFQNECVIRTIDDNQLFSPNDSNDVLTSGLKPTCNCSDQFSGDNCQFHASCGDPTTQCSQHGYKLPILSYISTKIPSISTGSDDDDEDVDNAVSETVWDIDITCNDTCQCTIPTFFSPLDDCFASNINCHNGDVKPTGDSCQCHSGYSGQFCQCKKVNQIELYFVKKVDSFETVASAWHKSLLLDLETDTGIDARRFIFSHEEIITLVEGGKPLWKVLYDVIECTDDDYNGIENHVGNESAFVVQHFNHDNSLPLFSSSRVNGVLSLIHLNRTSSSSSQLHDFIPMDTYTTLQTTGDDFQSQWEQLSKLPPQYRDNSHTYNGVASQEAGGVSSIGKPADPDGENPDNGNGGNPDPTDDDNNNTTLILIIVLGIILPCAIFICLIFLLFFFRNRKMCFWSEQFQKAQQDDINTFQDLNGEIISTGLHNSFDQKQIELTSNTTVATHTTAAAEHNNDSDPYNAPNSHRYDRNHHIERSEAHSDAEFNPDRDEQDENSNTVSNDNNSNTTAQNTEKSSGLGFGNTRRESCLPIPVEAVEDEEPLPPGWKRLQNDGSNGRVYYFNEDTLQSSWYHPNKIDPNAKLATMGLRYPSLGGF